MTGDVGLGGGGIHVSPFNAGAFADTVDDVQRGTPVLSLIVCGLMQAALPVNDAITPEATIAEEMSAPALRVAVVSVTPGEGRCLATRLLVSPTGRQALARAALPRLDADADAAVTTMTVDGTRLGHDAQQRRCKEPVKLTVSLTPRRPPPAVGSPIVLALTGPGFVVEAAGVVIPCRSADRERSTASNLVCARSSTGRILKGTLDENNDNTLVVTP